MGHSFFEAPFLHNFCHKCKFTKKSPMTSVTICSFRNDSLESELLYLWLISNEPDARILPYWDMCHISKLKIPSSIQQKSKRMMLLCASLYVQQRLSRVMPSMYEVEKKIGAAQN